jgi:hypothetical protein
LALGACGPELTGAGIVIGTSLPIIRSISARLVQLCQSLSQRSFVIGAIAVEGCAKGIGMFAASALSPESGVARRLAFAAKHALIFRTMFS